MNDAPWPLLFPRPNRLASLRHIFSRSQPFSFGLALTALFTGCAGVQDTMYDLHGRPAGKVAIVVDLTDQQAFLYAGRNVALEAPISTGREGHDTRPGKYKVIQKDLDHRSSVYGAFCGPGNIIIKPDVDVRKDSRPAGTHFVGAPMPYFLRIYGGVGMHAGYLPGYPASHGCIRMPEGKARRFFEAAKLGTPVVIVP
jgi:lipoprotein-anchoring transpeptidase ErfK/SrfK